MKSKNIYDSQPKEVLEVDLFFKISELSHLLSLIFSSHILVLQLELCLSTEHLRILHHKANNVTRGHIRKGAKNNLR